MKRLLCIAIMASALAMSEVRAADVYVVVSADSALQTLTAKQLQSLYMGRNRLLPTGSAATLYDLPTAHPVRDAFYSALTGMSPAQVNSYWSRLVFTGQTLPPQALADEQTMVALIKRSPNAMGYLSREPEGDSLRTLLVLKTRSPE